jgi:hypothetical protein
MSLSAMAIVHLSVNSATFTRKVSVELSVKVSVGDNDGVKPNSDRIGLNTGENQQNYI